MSANVVLMDAHVHVYPGVNVAGLLGAAARHFRLAAERLGAAQWQGVLFLTEIAGTSWFDAVSTTAGGQTFGPWNVMVSPHDSLRLEARCDEHAFSIVAGRQIVTSERVEVHALGTSAKIPDGMAIDATVAAVRGAAALAVLPWGVGKWLGKRRGVVEKVLSCTQDVLVSDNGGRPALWRESILEHAARSGRPVLLGSDPLPVPAEEYRVGGFGCWMTEIAADTLHTPALLERIQAMKPDDLHRYGPPETLQRFFTNQLALRLRRLRA